ncbi:hypothetical protein DV36_38710 [Amycolatopsis mediterranei]|nr:hypothetical protein DV36_38710 [Amycolatopsis mediterranei]
MSFPGTGLIVFEWSLRSVAPRWLPRAVRRIVRGTVFVRVVVARVRKLVRHDPLVSAQVVEVSFA